MPGLVGLKPLTKLEIGIGSEVQRVAGLDRPKTWLGVTCGPRFWYSDPSNVAPSSIGVLHKSRPSVRKNNTNESSDGVMILNGSL